MAEYNRETIVSIIQKMYNTKQAKGRKLKPKNKLTLFKLIMVQLSTKPITVLGIFSKLPVELAKKIHDKNEYKNLTLGDYVFISNIILKYSKKLSNSCISHVTPEGVRILEDLKIGNIRFFKVRSIFNTQERQLVLG
jgi:hypothetical protein